MASDTELQPHGPGSRHPGIDRVRPAAVTSAGGGPALRERLPGLGLAVAVACVATVFGSFFPIVGGPVSGIVAGVVLAAIIKPGDRLRPGLTTASNVLLQASVAVTLAASSTRVIALICNAASGNPARSSV